MLRRDHATILDSKSDGGLGRAKKCCRKEVNSNPALQAMGMMELVHCTRRQCESEHCGYEHGECH